MAEWPLGDDDGKLIRQLLRIAIFAEVLIDGLDFAHPDEVRTQIKAAQQAARDRLKGTPYAA